MALVTARRTATNFLSRCLGPSPCSSSICSRSRFAIAVLNNQSLVNAITTPSRPKTTKSGYSPLKDPAPNWSNRPPKETILLDGCDYEHWLIILEFTQDPKPSREEMIDAYVKTLAEVVGSEAEAKKKIYSVCTTTYTGFGALMSEELSNKVKGLPGVLWVLPDSYLDVPNKDYGGDLYEDGKVTPRPQYWYNSRDANRNRPRPRYNRRQESVQVAGTRAPQNYRGPAQQPNSRDGQSTFQGVGGHTSPNQGQA